MIWHTMGLLPSAPGKVVAVHVSYRSRAAERGTTPAWPSYFLKPASDLSRLLTLEPGDLILTGTSPGKPASPWPASA
jgi:2-keto-4-pentenoate hydratase/2-oxohepta-3-ene-1,7-dioic acid hydratase in catechol pathway